MPLPHTCQNGRKTAVASGHPRRIVLVVQQGTGWALREDGGREALDAKRVMLYDTGAWVEYGSDSSGEAFRAEIYGAANFSPEQVGARWAGPL